MSRPRYPSDEKRKKQRPHVKIHLSVLSHRKTVGHFDQPEFRGQFLGLMMLAAERFAARLNGELHLSLRDIKWITGRSRADHASLSMCKLLDQLEYVYSLNDVSWVIQIPKFAKKQGYGPRSASMPPHDSADSGSPQGTKEPRNQRTKEPPGRKPPSADAVACAYELARTVKGIQPSRKPPPSLDPWARTYEKTLRVAGRTCEGVFAQLAWLASPANQDAEARFEVFAAEKHHKRYDDIARRMQRANPDAAAKARGDTVRAAREKREDAEHAQREADRDNTASPDEMRAAVKASREQRYKSGLRQLWPPGRT